MSITGIIENHEEISGYRARIRELKSQRSALVTKKKKYENAIEKLTDVEGDFEDSEEKKKTAEDKIEDLSSKLKEAVQGNAKSTGLWAKMVGWNLNGIDETSQIPGKITSVKSSWTRKVVNLNNQITDIDNNIAYYENRIQSLEDE